MIETLNGFLNGFFQTVLDLVIYLVNLILYPFDTLISNFIPGYADSTSLITNMLNNALNYINYLLDSFGFESVTILLLVNYLIFKITVPLQIWVVKLAIKWYDKLKV